MAAVESFLECLSGTDSTVHHAVAAPVSLFGGVLLPYLYRVHADAPGYLIQNRLDCK